MGVLTNGLVWEIHRVTLNRKVENENICTLDFESINPKICRSRAIIFTL